MTCLWPSTSIIWTGVNPNSRVVGVATDQQGLGTVYTYVFPADATASTDFFQVDGISRTFGLLQDSQNGLVPDPQWPYLSGPEGNSLGNTLGTNLNPNGVAPAPG